MRLEDNITVKTRRHGVDMTVLRLNRKDARVDYIVDHRINKDTSKLP